MAKLFEGKLTKYLIYLDTNFNKITEFDRPSIILSAISQIHIKIQQSILPIWNCQQLTINQKEQNIKIMKRYVAITITETSLIRSVELRIRKLTAGSFYVYFDDEYDSPTAKQPTRVQVRRLLNTVCCRQGRLERLKNPSPNIFLQTRIQTRLFLKNHPPTEWCAKYPHVRVLFSPLVMTRCPTRFIVNTELIRSEN